MPPWILHRLSLLSFSFCSIKATRPKICKKSVCCYCITISLWRTPVNYLNLNILQIKKRLVLRWMLLLKWDWINSIDYTFVSGIEPSSVILSQTQFRRWLKHDSKKRKTNYNQNGWHNKHIKIKMYNQFLKRNILMPL